MTRITITMEIWDNDITTAEKADILNYCEHAAQKTRNLFKNGTAPIRATERTKNAITMELDWEDWYYFTPDTFLRAYNRRLMRLHYWNRADEPLVMYWNLEQA